MFIGEKINEVFRKTQKEIEEAFTEWQEEEKERRTQIEGLPDLWSVHCPENNEFHIGAEGWREKVSGETVVLEFFIGEKIVGVFKEWKHVRKINRTAGIVVGHGRPY